MFMRDRWPQLTSGSAALRSGQTPLAHPVTTALTPSWSLEVGCDYCR